MRQAVIELLLGRAIGEGLVWSMGIVVDLPSPRGCLHGGRVQLARIALPELAADRAVEPPDPAVALGGAGRQDGEGDLALLTGRLAAGHELPAPVPLNALDRGRHPGHRFGEELLGGGGGGGTANAQDGTTGDHVHRRELAALDAGFRSRVHGVEIEEIVGLLDAN